LSHLVFAHPLSEPLDETLREAVSHTLNVRGTESTGWSLVWKIAQRARLHQPDAVSEALRFVFRDMAVYRGEWIGGLYPNLLAAHPPFQIDGNFGFVTGLSECLLQSHAGYIELLPAVPAELGEGRVRGLVARPGVEVDIDWALDATGHAAPSRVALRLVSDAVDTVDTVDVTVRFRTREVVVPLQKDRVVDLALSGLLP